MKPTPLRLGPCALLALSACSGSGGGSSGLPLVNLGLSAVALQGQGDLWVLEVSELAEGASDRNGDGDASDATLTVYDLSDFSLTDIALAFTRAPAPLAVGDVLVAFGVSEADQGGTDLNGDGDAADVVLHVYDANARAVTNTGLALAARQPAIGAANVAFAVDEAAQGGQDLDGDGDAADAVLHVYDSRTQLATNAQRALTSEIIFHDHAFGHTTDEPSAGADLNNDGDQTDTNVFETFDVVLGGIVGVPLSSRARSLATQVEDWYVLADEAQEGADLDGDGDQADGVYFGIEPHLGTQEALALSSTDAFGSIADDFRIAFVLQEVDGLDHTGDGDTLDTSVALYDSVTGVIFESTLAIDPAATLAFVDDRMAFAADEASSGRDLNGDGDQLDDVLQTMVKDTGLVLGSDAAVTALQESGGILLVARDEAEAGADWNGDGDQDDMVESYRAPFTDVLTSTGIAGNGRAWANDESVLLVASEAGEHRDLNRDGDETDLVYVLHDRAAGTNTSLEVAVTLFDATLLADGRALLLVSEAGQGEDLNEDGDLDDSVLHLLTFSL